MSSVAQLLNQADALKGSVSDSSKTISETWVTRQKLEDIYKKILLTDIEYALDKKVEQELWNHAFKNQINILQTQAKDKQNLKRAEVQATLNLFLETASGFYLQFLQSLCTTFKLDLPCRRKSAIFGVLKEKTPMRLKVTPPKKSSCLYVCQHCLVHLGDIARYRQQIDQAQTYYWHAAYLVPFNGQPYNQLAILEAAKGNKLSTVFYYIRSLAVKVPFPVAATNLEKLYIKLTKEAAEIKGKPSASEMITGFLQFHALVHLCTDLSKAEELSDTLATGLPAHVTSQSFPWQVLVQIVAINIFAMNHVQNELNGNGETSLCNGHLELSGDEEKCFNLVFSLTVSMLDILLQYTPKQEHKVCEYFTLPAIKMLLDWFKVNPQIFTRPVLTQSLLWDNLCKVLNCIQSCQIKNDDDCNMSQYEDCPLPEDAELRCFQPLEKAQSGYSYSKLPLEGLNINVEIRLRCHRLLELGHWIMAEQKSVNLSVQTNVAGCPQFTTPTLSVQSSGVTKTVTLAVPSSHASSTPSIQMSVPNPERRPNRQNVAIQAIMQKQAQNKVQGSEETPASSKYLLGVPSTEPMFFKAGGPKLGQTSGSPQSQLTPSGNNNTNKVTGAGQGGGVLVLKNPDYLSPPTKPSVPQQQTKSWQQQRQTTWQHQSKPAEKTNFDDAQTSPQVQNPSQWQQQNAMTHPQQSPQSGGHGPWIYPVQPQPNFTRPDFRSRSPMTAQTGFSNKGPAPSVNTLPFFSQGQARPNFSQGHKSSHGQGQFGSDQQYKGQMTSGGSVQNQLSTPSQVGPGSMQNSLPTERFGVPHLGSGDGLGLSFGPIFSTMFTHPPPSSRFPPPSNFSGGPSPDSCSTHAGIYQGSSQINRPSERNNAFPGNSNLLSNQAGTNFPHAPGTERVRDKGPQTPPHIQTPFPQNQFMGPYQGFMGFSSMSNKQPKGSPIESLFVKPQFPTDNIPPNIVDIIGTLSKIVVQPPRENVFPTPAVGHISFQGHAEGTPKPDVYSSQRSSSMPTVNIDLEPKVTEATVSSQVTQPQQQGTYSLFSGSPWLSGDTKSIGSSPFSSESNSIRNSPDPNLDTFTGDMKTGQPFDMGLRFGTVEDMGLRFGTIDDKKVKHSETQHFFQNNVQSIWSNPSQSPLERLLEIQRQQRPTEPH